MSRRPNRPRRTATSQQINVLRLLGWRYSAARDAWVHRIGNGRMGPVFRERDAIEEEPTTSIDTTLFDAIVATRAAEAARSAPVVAPASERAPLPQRTEAPRVDVTARRSEPTASVRAVEVSLAPDEAPRVVNVDGRPPTLGAAPSVGERSDDGVVVPIDRGRATA